MEITKQRESVQFVVVSINQQLYSFLIEDVVEFLRVPVITTIPGISPLIEGVINLRGNIIPVVNLHKQFNLPIPKKHNVFSVNVELVEDAQMKSVRALIVQNNLKKCGEIIASFPSIEDIENEDIFDGTMTFILLTFRTATYVSDSLQQITDIKSVHVDEVIISTDEAPVETVVAPSAPQQEAIADQIQGVVGNAESLTTNASGVSSSI